jgi:hypothetical protein
MYFYISSVQQPLYFNENSSNSFRVKLPVRLSAQTGEDFELALLDIQMPAFTPKSVPQYITINSQICQPSVLESHLQPVLYKLSVDLKDADKNSITIDQPRYIPLNVRDVDVLDIYIKDSDGQPASFAEGHTSCTLHLRRTDSRN